ncbi:hypothetical protein AB205_0068050 [Aquarana catesbeiana]|uniref:Secreted protein n=1 Tax=Aquarana catesbeiana TaxID=8400 RepID=A0A2G9RHT7_AQUCT|nr:hypothetical protein AB205_0068050 [Aquarana catesbeiana]
MDWPHPLSLLISSLTLTTAAANGALCMSQPIKRESPGQHSLSHNITGSRWPQVSIGGAKGGCCTQKAFYLNA